MNVFSNALTQENRGRSLVVASALIVIAALLVPGSIWADHASEHPEQGPAEAEASASSTFSFTASCPYASAASGEFENACEFRSGLVKLFKSGQLAYNAPGR